jgi:hypothetical protein
VRGKIDIRFASGRSDDGSLDNHHQAIAGPLDVFKHTFNLVIREVLQHLPDYQQITNRQWIAACIELPKLYILEAGKALLVAVNYYLGNVAGNIALHKGSNLASDIEIATPKIQHGVNGALADNLADCR